MTDVELAALSALVQAVASLPGHGVEFAPDWESMDALRTELRRRGCLPSQPDGEGGT